MHSSLPPSDLAPRAARGMSLASRPNPAQGGQPSQEFTAQMFNEPLPGRAAPVALSWGFILKPD